MAGYLLVLCVTVTGGYALDWSTHGFLQPLPIAAVDSQHPSCREDSLLLVAALENRTLWAEQKFILADGWLIPTKHIVATLTVWDASAKVPVGLLTGTNTQLGNYDECLGVRSPLQSQYCLVTVMIQVPTGHDTLDPETEEYLPTSSAWDKIHYGGSRAKQRLDKIKMAVCVPASCSPADIESTVSKHFQESNQSVQSVLVEPGACSRVDDPAFAFTAGDIAFCVAMAVIFVTVTASTIYDMVAYDYDGHSPPNNLVQCLSAQRGCRGLFRRDQGLAELDLSSLYGIHVFAFVFIVLGHRFGAYMITTIINYEDIEYMFRHYWLSMWTGHMDLCCDIFFCLSAFLLGVILSVQLDKSYVSPLKMFRHYWLSMWTGHMDLFCDIFFCLSAFLLGVILSVQLDKSYVSPLKVYVHRLVRLLPVYATTVFFYATLFPKLGDGPVWNFVVKLESDQCRNYWWVNLLFLNNYLGGHKMCLLQSWYVTCDFQLFLAGTLVLLLLNRRPVLGLPASALLMIVCTVAPFLGTYWYKLPAVVTFYREFWELVRDNELYTSVYSQAHYRGSGYLVGVLAGYAVFKWRSTQLSRVKTWFLIIIGYSICFFTYWSGSLYTDPSRPYHLLEASLYAALSHSIFAFGLCLTLWAFVLGTKTWVSEIYSWRGFVPLSKLSYTMYMVHNIPQMISAASSRTPVKFNAYGLVSWTIADLVLGLLLSLVVFLYIETPCRYLFKHFTSSHPPQHPDSVKTSEDVKDVKDASDWSYRITNP